MMRKCQKSGEDQYLALLNIRNTPTQGTESSPAQRSLQRRTKALIPITDNLLQPYNKEATATQTEQLKQIQHRSSHYYDKAAHDLQPLEEGNVVRMKPFKIGDKVWKKAQVTQRLDERSYQVISEDVRNTGAIVLV